MWILRLASTIKRRRAGLAALGLLVLSALPEPARTETPNFKGVPLFQVPAVEQRARLAALALQRRDLASTERIVKPLLGQYPDVTTLNIFQATVEMGRNNHEAALDHLENAARNGTVAMADIMKAQTFEPLRHTERGRALIQSAALPTIKPADPEPAIADPKTNAVVIGPANTVWRPDKASLFSTFKVPRIFRRRPAVTSKLLTGREAEAARMVNSLVQRGKAAGLRGDLYDNRDAAHSVLRKDIFPQLAVTTYSPEARQAGLHYGSNMGLLFDGITLGNSSTAITGGTFWRSQPRALMTNAIGARRMAQLAAENHLYVFPGVNDMGWPHNGWLQDLFPANQPYMLISEGASSSDQPLMRAAAMIMAAFRPDTKEFLREEGLATSTIQWAFRQGIRDGEGYADFTGPLAHPSVFNAERLDPVKMVEAANALQRGDVPPAVKLKLLRGTFDRRDLGSFANGLSPSLYQTEGSIALIWHGPSYRQSFTVSVGDTKDPNGRPLTFEWRLLRGDPDHVRITPANEAGTTANITFEWQEAQPVPDRPDRTSTRIDIAVFAHNGVHRSMPSFVSMKLPPDQIRRYEPDPDRGMRIAEIDYADPERLRVYADPMIFPLRRWRDTFNYDAKGNLTGFTRHRREGSQAYTRHGHRVLTIDAQGRPLTAEQVAYPIKTEADKRPLVDETATGRIMGYRYSGPNDQMGVVSPQ